MLACIAAISFPFQGGEQASKRASEKLGGVRQKENGVERKRNSLRIRQRSKFRSLLFARFFWKRLLRSLGRCRWHFTYTGVPRWPRSAKNTPGNTINVIFENEDTLLSFSLHNQHNKYTVIDLQTLVQLRANDENTLGGMEQVLLPQHTSITDNCVNLLISSNIWFVNSSIS